MCELRADLGYTVQATPLWILLFISSTFSSQSSAHVELVPVGAYRDIDSWIRPSQLKKRAPATTDLRLIYCISRFILRFVQLVLVGLAFL